MYFLTRYLNNVGIRKAIIIITCVKKSQLDGKKGSKGKKRKEWKGQNKVSLSLSLGLIRFKRIYLFLTSFYYHYS